MIKIDGARSMKKVLRFMVGLLINVIILLALVKLFAGSYNFAYQIFATTCKEAGNTKTVSIEIHPDDTLLDVCDTIDKAGVIDSKMAFFLKVRISGLAPKIIPGTYNLSASQTNKEIMYMITGTKE